MTEEEIVCPTCAQAHPPSERFCESCGMPLVHASATEQVLSERQQRARKINPQYAEGDLVRVAHAESQPEAEFIAGLLLEEGIPCVLRNSIGGYSPIIDPRDVMVPESGAQAAREALRWDRPAV
jgi:Putative prokaryotic signal transducing protein